MSLQQKEISVLELKLGRKVNEGNEVNQEGQSIAGHNGSLTPPSTRLPTRNSASTLSSLFLSPCYCPSCHFFLPGSRGMSNDQGSKRVIWQIIHMCLLVKWQNMKHVDTLIRLYFFPQDLLLATLQTTRCSHQLLYFCCVIYKCLLCRV